MSEPKLELQSKSDNNELINIVMDMSKFDLFEFCPCKFNFRYNHKRVLPIVQKARSLDDGGLMHSAYEVYYKELAKGKDFVSRVDAAMLRLNTIAADPELSNAEEEDIKLITNVLIENLSYWRHEDEHFEILGVEDPFAYILYEDELIRLIISGKIDLTVNKPPLGREPGYKKLPFDHKTFRREFPTIRLSNQFINYSRAVGSNYLIVNKVGLQKTKSAEERFKRVPLSYDPIYVKQWEDNIIDVILHEYIPCISRNKWPMRFSSCLKFGRLCEYHDICDSSGEDSKLFKLENNYVIAPERKRWEEDKSDE